MKPEHEARRKIIREWMSLPKEKRQSEEQAKPFAKKEMERIPSSADPYRQIMRWLLPRIGKPCPPAKTIVRSLPPFQCLSLYRKSEFCNNGDEARRGKRAHGLRITAPGRNHCKYELAINLETAKVLGLDVPPTLPANLCAIRSRARAAGDAEVQAGGSSVSPRRDRQL